MTATARKIDEVENSLYARREALQAEQAKLNEEHGAAALAAAEGIQDATRQIPAIKQKLREIQDELAALDAADRVLNCRKHEATIKARMNEVKTAAARIPSAAAKVSDAWTKFEASMAEMGRAWEMLEAATDEANRLGRICQMAGAPAERYEVSNNVSVHLLQSMAGKLLWIATKDKIQHDPYSFGNTPATPAEVRERIDYSLNNLKVNAQRHTERALAVIQRDA
jgi:chromosome segregation ATPase